VNNTTDVPASACAAVGLYLSHGEHQLTAGEQRINKERDRTAALLIRDKIQGQRLFFDLEMA